MGEKPVSLGDVRRETTAPASSVVVVVVDNDDGGAGSATPRGASPALPSGLPLIAKLHGTSRLCALHCEAMEVRNVEGETAFVFVITPRVFCSPRTASTRQHHWRRAASSPFAHHGERSLGKVHRFQRKFGEKSAPTGWREGGGTRWSGLQRALASALASLEKRFFQSLLCRAVHFSSSLPSATNLARFPQRVPSRPVLLFPACFRGNFYFPPPPLSLALPSTRFYPFAFPLLIPRPPGKLFAVRDRARKG